MHVTNKYEKDLELNLDICSQIECHFWIHVANLLQNGLIL